jgi:ribonuclease VapC
VIVVDPSALLAVIRNEAEGSAIEAFIRSQEKTFLISAASFVEAFIATERRLSGGGGGRAMERLCKRLLIEPVPFDITQMAWAVDAFERFGQGRGREPALLNFGDCLSYGLARSRDAPLLFVGEDFAKTDIVSALRAED